MIGKRFPKIAADLAAILDDWAIHRGGEPTDVEQMKRLIMLAQQIDAVAWRTGFGMRSCETISEQSRPRQPLPIPERWTVIVCNFWPCAPRVQ